MARSTVVWWLLLGVLCTGFERFSQLDGGMISGEPTLSCTVQLVWWQLLAAVVIGCVVGGCDDLSCAFVDLLCEFSWLLCELSRLLFAFV